jgi:hypothetical protein
MSLNAPLPSLRRCHAPPCGSADVTAGVPTGPLLCVPCLPTPQLQSGRTPTLARSGLRARFGASRARGRRYTPVTHFGYGHLPNFILRHINASTSEYRQARFAASQHVSLNLHRLTRQPPPYCEIVSSVPNGAEARSGALVCTFRCAAFRLEHEYAKRGAPLALEEAGPREPGGVTLSHCMSQSQSIASASIVRCQRARQRQPRASQRQWRNQQSQSSKPG